MTEMKVVNVIGPLSGNSALIVLSGNGKTVSIRSNCYDADICAESLSCNVVKASQNSSPFAYLRDVLNAVGIRMDRLVLDVVDGSVVATLLLKSNGKKIILPSPSIATSINACLIANKKIFASKEVLKKVQDGTAQYQHLKSELGMMWPLSKVCETELLMSMSDLVDFSIGS